jgi:hypothetical protein
MAQGPFKGNMGRKRWKLKNRPQAGPEELSDVTAGRSIPDLLMRGELATNSPLVSVGLV